MRIVGGLVMNAWPGVPGLLSALSRGSIDHWPGSRSKAYLRSAGPHVLPPM